MQKIICTISILIIAFNSACSVVEEPIRLGDQIRIPTTDFTFRPPVDYEIKDLSETALYLKKPETEGGLYLPKLLISGHSFEANESRETWTEAQLSNPDWGPPTQLLINDIPGYVSTYQGKSNQEIVTVKVAVLTTEQQGIVIHVNSSHDMIDEAEKLFNAVIETISISP